MNSPKSFTSSELSKVGIIKRGSNCICEKCGEEWESQRKGNGLLWQGYWLCDNGCNSPQNQTEGAQLDQRIASDFLEETIRKFAPSLQAYGQVIGVFDDGDSCIELERVEFPSGNETAPLSEICNTLESEGAIRFITTTDQITEEEFGWMGTLWEGPGCKALLEKFIEKVDSKGFPFFLELTDGSFINAVGWKERRCAEAS